MEALLDVHGRSGSRGRIFRVTGEERTDAGKRGSCEREYGGNEKLSTFHFLFSS